MSTHPPLPQKMNQDKRIYTDPTKKIRHMKWKSRKNSRPEMYHEDIWDERYSSVF